MLLKREQTRPRNMPDSLALFRGIPRFVTQVRIYPKGDIYPVCPRCGRSLDREYMNFCDFCGQRLAWEVFHFQRISADSFRE